MFIREEKNKQEDIRRAIIKVIVFFDIFDFPLTVFEIRKYLDIKCECDEIMKVLENGQQQNIVEQKNGFYFLTDRDDIVITRMKRYGYGFRKFNRALFITRFFLLIPWVKLVAIGNIIGNNNLKEESDIDIFIVTQAGRIWLTRFFAVLITKIFRLRPTVTDVKDKICLSFFISADNLNLENIALPNDIYLRYWLADLTPIFIRDDSYNKLIDSNQWFKNSLPNWIRYESYRRKIKDFIPKFRNVILDFIFGWTEFIAKAIQLKFMPDDLKAMMNKDSRVVVSDKMLKFHRNDRREEYNKMFLNKIENIFSRFPLSRE